MRSARASGRGDLAVVRSDRRVVGRCQKNRKKMGCRGLKVHEEAENGATADDEEVAAVDAAAVDSDVLDPWRNFSRQIRSKCGREGAATQRRCLGCLCVS